LNPCPATGCSVCAALPSATASCARRVAGIFHDERKRAAVGNAGEAARSRAEVARELRQEFLVVERQQFLRPIGCRGPDETVAVVLGQKRHRTFRRETLERGSVVRMRVETLRRARPAGSRGAAVAVNAIASPVPSATAASPARIARSPRPRFRSPRGVVPPRTAVTVTAMSHRHARRRASAASSDAWQRAIADDVARARERRAHPRRAASGRSPRPAKCRCA
jgi:hypothetical protein